MGCTFYGGGEVVEASSGKATFVPSPCCCIAAASVLKCWIGLGPYILINIATKTNILIHFLMKITKHFP